MSAPIPSTSTSIGSAAATRAGRAPRSGSYMSTNCAAAAGPLSSVSRISRAFERGLSSETIRSSVGITRMSSQARSASDSAARNGPGVVPPGTASVACPLPACAARSWSATSSARSRISVSRSG